MADLQSLTYLSTVDKPKKGILGTLEGVCADTINATRNGRKYSDALWDKVFKDPIVEEYFNCGGIFGELGHPAESEERDETDLSKIAICMPEPPTKNSDGQLVGRWDILDTPNGRILKCLCDYGYKIGISSRGSGDIISDWDGTESVDPDTYTFQAFDAVLLPAVKSARLNLVSESLNTNKIKLRKALQESLNNSSEEDRKIMTDTLDELEIDYKQPSETEDDNVNPPDELADNAGNDLVKDLQEALRENKRLKDEIATLNEKLSVSYTKEKRLDETVSKLKQSARKLTESSTRVSTLRTQLNATNNKLQESIRQSQQQAQKTESYKKRFKDTVAETKSLKENMEKQSARIDQLCSTLSSTRKDSVDAQRQISSLTESINELKKDSKLKNAQYEKNLSAQKKLTEKFRTVASTAVEKYIECRATNLGISTNDIKNKLGKNYSFDEIDRVCESLRTYKRNMSKLPFAIQKEDVSGVAVKEDLATKRFENPDDVVDSSLFNLMNN